MIAMGRRKTVEGAMANPAMTFYCPPSLKDSFSDLCKSLNVSLSERLRDLMNKDISSNGGKVKIEFNYALKDGERVGVTEQEKKMRVLLQKDLIIVQNKVSQSAFEVMCRFAQKLSPLGPFNNGFSDSKKIQLCIAELDKYEIEGNEPFTLSHKLSFITYLELTVKRLGLEKELSEHRQKKTNQ
jgi:hypothetical protein